MSKKTKLGSWFTDPIKRSWVEETKKTSKNLINESDLDWVRDVPSSVPSWEDREKIDLVGFLIELAEFDLDILDDLNNQGVLEPTDEYRMGYTDEEWDEYGFDRWRDVDWKADGMMNTQLDREALSFSHDIIYYLENANHPKWEFVKWDTTEYNLEHSTHKDIVIVKNKKQDRYFAIYLEGSPWDGVNFDENSLVEVFPKKITKTIYESKITNKTIVENDFEWASEFNWSKEMLDDMLSDCKTLKVANFNVSTKEPYLSAGGPSIMFLSRCKEWWNYFGGLPLGDSGRGPAEWFSEDNYDDGEYGVIWNPSWARKKITPQLEDLKDDYTSAITTPWGYGIEKQLNGISNSEAWFVVDENNKPIYNLIPNTVKEYAKIYEEEFFGNKLNESEDFKWVEKHDINNFFDEYFEKENFYMDTLGDEPSKYDLSSKNSVFVSGDNVFINISEEEFTEEIMYSEDYILHELLKRGVYDDSNSQEFDQEEMNYINIPDPKRLETILQDYSEELPQFIEDGTIQNLINTHKLNKITEIVKCPKFDTLWAEFSDDFLVEYALVISNYKSELVTQVYNDIVENLNFEFGYDRGNSIFEFTFNKDDFFNYFSNNRGSTIEDYLTHKLKPIIDQDIQQIFYDAYGGDWGDLLGYYYDNFIDKLEDFVWSGELEDCIKGVEEWESLGFEIRGNNFSDTVDNAWMEIVTPKFTHEKDISHYYSTEKKTETKPFVFTARLDSDTNRCILLKAHYRDVWGTPITLHQSSRGEKYDEGITPRQAKKLVSDFMKNNTQQSVNKLLFDDKD